MSTRFNVCDLNAIETRVGAWLAECHDLMKVFEPWTDPRGKHKPNGKCPYLTFGGDKMYGMGFDALYADYEGWNGKERKGAAKRMRQMSKPPVLAAIYRLSGGQLMPKKMKDGTTVMVRTGLWDYADKMGIDMTQKQANDAVDVFRNSYPEICDPKVGVWKRLENAVAEVMHPDHPETVRYIGPNNCVKIDRLNIANRYPIMRMQLPSGRYLHYVDARLEPTLMPWKGEDEDGEPIDVYRDSLIYAATNQKTKQWGTTNTHGGKLFENLVQGIARDILAVKLVEFEERDLPVFGHVHDEGIVLVENDLLSPTVHDMVEIMSREVNWAPGLLLGADGFEELYYHK